MKNIYLSLSVIAVLGFTSCKENASSKINASNVEVAAERDQASKNLPVMQFEKSEHDFGTIEQGTPQETVFKFTNTGNAPLIITDAKSTCGCTVPEKPEAPVAPGETSELLVRFNGQGNGQVTKNITVTANTAKGSEIIRIKAQVNPKGTAPVGPVIE